MFWEIIHNMYNNKQFLPNSVHSLQLPEYKCLINIENLKEIFYSCADFECREILFGLNEEKSLTICWLDGTVSSFDISESVIRPLTEFIRSIDTDTEQQSLSMIKSGAVYRYSVKHMERMDELVSALCHGSCALIFNGINQALTFEVRGTSNRAVSEPTLEKSLKGSKDSFVEVLRINTALVRRRICSPKLKLIESTVGRKTRTQVSLMFVEDVASKDTVEELARRLDALDVDGLLATGTLEEYIVDAPRSIFPQLLHTERPDRFANFLLEGRVGLLVDGLPIGLVLPVTLAEFMKVTGDYYNHFLVSTALTVLRYIALLLSILLPAVYVATAMYHQEMIPTKMLLSIIEAKQNVPFSTALEVIGMLLSFELLQEAGLRLPNPIGDTVSIIGALIVGQSAVEARVVSPIAIIVVAFAEIAGYILPSQDLGAAVRLLRMGLVIAAVLGGLFGVGAGLCLLLLHIARINSFGTNYSAPLSDGDAFPLMRLLIRKPKPWLKYRDSSLGSEDRRRQK